jgi:hypothetical protein
MSDYNSDRIRDYAALIDQSDPIVEAILGQYEPTKIEFEAMQGRVKEAEAVLAQAARQQERLNHLLILLYRCAVTNTGREWNEYDYDGFPKASDPIWGKAVERVMLDRMSRLAGEPASMEATNDSAGEVYPEPEFQPA